MYPRKYFMEQVCGVLVRSGRAVPVFNDKHLSYNWHDALWMVERAAHLGAHFMAGSSAPLGWRSPWLEHPLDTAIDEALVVGYAGLDSYGFHALEVLQCMVERRVGGEFDPDDYDCREVVFIDPRERLEDRLEEDGFLGLQTGQLPNRYQVKARKSLDSQSTRKIGHSAQFRPATWSSVSPSACRARSRLRP